MAKSNMLPGYPYINKKFSCLNFSCRSDAILYFYCDYMSLSIVLILQYNCRCENIVLSHLQIEFMWIFFSFRLEK